jgi:hypothetical protein
MNEIAMNATATTVPAAESHEVLAALKSVALSTAFLLRIMAATNTGAKLCFAESTARTQVPGAAHAESSTQLREMAPELRAKLHAILDSAREDVIEDGMHNAITRGLPELIWQDFSTVIPALNSVIETGRTPPIISAEVLKELGRIRNAASHASRRWVLERALSLPAPMIRDAAGLGLAWLGDPSSFVFLRRAVENETDAQTKADLQLVMNELAETITNGAPVTHDQ